MKRKTGLRAMLAMCSFAVMATFCVMLLNSCGGSNTSKTEENSAEKVDETAFNATQPVESGLYDADYYDIVGKNSRKGRFDGRIYFALSPEMSAFNVFENGNRTKIDYTDILQKPFEKGDSGIYCSIDRKDNPVTLVADSTYVLTFIHNADTVSIGFNPKPRHTATAVEVLEKINERKEKK
ncbi:MAG: hypothetical protein J1F38_02785 [Muribaculaceae bacterium]|nr:hypothetical protein [Muribaculaceae bacterium]